MEAARSAPGGEGAEAVAVSVVVPARNVAPSLPATLDALGPQLLEVGAEVVLVDDASSDGTGLVAVDWSVRNPSVRCTVIRADRRYGINGSRNAGVAFSRGSFVAFCDGDDEVHPGWLRHLVDRRAPNVMVTGRAVDSRSGLVFSPHSFYGVGLPLVFGGCFGLERSILDGVGGFDEQIRRGGTESDLVLCAQLDHGATVVTAPDALVTYRLPHERWDQRRRRFAQQRGHAYIARRLAARRDGTTSTFTVTRRARGALAHLLAAMIGGRGARRDRWEKAITELVAIGWLVRFMLHLPPPRRADPAVRDRYAVLTAAAPAGSVVSKSRREPSP